MFKRILKVSVVFITLFYFCMDSIYAYEFAEEKNERGVNSTIDDIYDSRQLYDEIFGFGEETIDLMSSDMMWWPIGSIETVTIGGELFAPNEPQTVSRSDGFGCFEWRADKEKGEKCGWHNGLDISGLGLPPGSINVIAVKDGTVIYPTAEYQTQYKDHSGSAYRNGDGDGLGNYVVIQHSDGTQSVYGHMAFNSITVKANDPVRQGQVIGKVGHTGSSTAAHLHFGVKVNGKYVDPLLYIDPLNPRPQGTGSTFSLEGTTLSRSEFIAKMENYCSRTGRKGFCDNFASQAGEIYDVAERNGINPELVVVYAGAESEWKLDDACAYTHNYWGVGIYNGQPCNSGGVYDSLSEGIVGFAGVVKKYIPGGSKEADVRNTYNKRVEAKCDAAGHGLPGTMEGMQSLYSYIGEYRYDPGDWNLGGCVYLNHYIYSDNYCKTKSVCKTYGYKDGKLWQDCPENTKTTVCEQNDYAAFRVSKHYKIRHDIFGL